MLHIQLRNLAGELAIRSSGEESDRFRKSLLEMSAKCRRLAVEKAVENPANPRFSPCPIIWT